MGIYLHIPFCKQACSYCDFHFSTSVKNKATLIDALVAEVEIRKQFFQGKPIETIYFGGGTPSILTVNEIQLLLQAIYRNFQVAENPEITLEANPDDLTDDYLQDLAKIGFNRLSVGVQSFFDDDLQLMNRAHNASHARHSIEIAKQYFDNISIDLIYGIPGMSNKKWRKNIAIALELGVQHISSYALTVEPRTALKKQIAAGTVAAPKDEVAVAHFQILVEQLNKNNFVHYEISNFGKPNFFSRNNSSYWLGKSYLGIGPSAHSFDGISRSWNISNNAPYIKSLNDKIVPSETEKLSKTDLYNETIMTGLRTIWGVSLAKIANDFGQTYMDYLLERVQKFESQKLLKIENHILLTTAKGKFLCDGIASDLFFID